jgi:hypothetical protein
MYGKRHSPNAIILQDSTIDDPEANARQEMPDKPKDLMQIPTRESTVSILILLILLGIGAAIFLSQFSYNEEQFNPAVLQNGSVQSSSGQNGADNLSELAPEGFLPMSGLESFNSETLSDKIDGKADLYLEAGFISLVAGRFSNADSPELWFEFYLFHLDSPRNAFAVYSSQKREGVRSQDFAPFAYVAGNAVFFVHGPYYVEIIAAAENADLLESMVAMAKKFIHQNPENAVILKEMSYFPRESLDPGSIRILLHNGFGFDKFDNLVTGTYQREGRTLTVFLSIRNSDREAETLAQSYAAFISDLTGEGSTPPDSSLIPNLKILNLFDEYEMVFAKGRFIAGLHACPDKKLGEKLVKDLYLAIEEQEK